MFALRVIQVDTIRVSAPREISLYLDKHTVFDTV